MHWDADISPARNAKAALPKLARRWFKAGRRAFGAEVRNKDLHAFRLETKRFRYTLELFRPLYGPGLERRLELLKEMQGSLGELHDCATAGEHLARAKAAENARKTMERHLAKCADRHRAEILHLWEDEFNPARKREQWMRYLARPTNPR